MSFPIIWEEYDDFILSDVKESIQKQLKEFQVKHYIEENTICEMIKYKDEENYAEDHDFYLDHIFRDQCSLVILYQKTEQIVAAAIMKTMTKDMRSWTAIRLVSKSRKLNSLITIARQMISEADEKLNKPTGVMHIFELCAMQNDPDTCGTQDWIQTLFYGAYRIAQSMKMPLVTFIGFSQSEQAEAIAANFTEVSRIFYPTYTELDGNRPISPSDTGEMYAVLYYKEVEPFVPHEKLS